MIRFARFALVSGLAGAALLGQTQDGSKAANQTRRAADAILPSRQDLAYGPHARNALDLWLARSERPTPLLVYIHGGGFVKGDKSSASTRLIQRALDSGVSFAAVNYRFLASAPVQDILRDCARAVQYLRSRAGEFHLDKTRVAVMGSSAGAGTSLWLAFHDDLADPNSPDPVLRESSRVAAAVASSTQATYDVLRWAEFLGEAAASYRKGDAAGAAFFGLKSLEDLNSPAGRKIRADVDMLAWVSKDDPPVYLVSSKRFENPDSRGAVLHSPLHAYAVKRACDAAGVPATVRVIDESEARSADADYFSFLLGRLGVKAK